MPASRRLIDFNLYLFSIKKTAFIFRFIQAFATLFTKDLK